MSEKHECEGGDDYACLQPSLEVCAIACKNRSSMFIYGRADGDETRCYGGKCRCACEAAASKEGSCTEVPHTGYNVYKYAPGNDGFIYRNRG